MPNNDPHPSAIRLGSQSNPINNTAGPAVSNINLGRSGAPGMPAGNSGFGPPSRIAIAGSGSPNGSMGGRDTGPQPIRGISTGVSGATGPLSARPVGAIQIAKATPPPTIPGAQPTAAPAKVAPKLLFKPRPEYTEEARQPAPRRYCLCQNPRGSQRQCVCGGCAEWAGSWARPIRN